MLALAEYEDGLCECGLHESLTGDKANHFTFVDQHCPVCAGVAQYGRKQGAADERVRESMGKDVAPERPLPSDGRRTFVRMMAPDEVSRLRKPR